MPAVMIMGTGSGAGKSLISAGLCRAFTRRGLVVRPFKPQNMSNNAAVTADGGEIGRAQALQAMAANVEPSIHMNPVLLKPQSDTGAQVVVHGHAIGSASAQDYHSLKPRLMAAVMESFTQLSQQADIIIVEGAGSPAEINLRQHDIANMGFARQANIPAILVGDVDRGGVIAAMTGTASLLDTSDRQLLKGFVINRFRGDQSLFEPALSMIQQRTGMEPLGIIPFFPDAQLLPAEDAANLTSNPPKTAESFRAEKKDDILVAVPMFSRISNFDDLDPLRAETGVEVRFVPPGKALPACDLIVLPGSKAVISDLGFCRRQGWDIDIRAHVRRGGCVVGLCGGFQMLGRSISDPAGVEGSIRQAPGFALLDVESSIGPMGKTLARVHGMDLTDASPVAGYEIHAGRTSGAGLSRPMLRLNGNDHGAVSPDGNVCGCYLHGLFTMDQYRRNFLIRLRKQHSDQPTTQYLPGIEQTLEKLATMMEESLDMNRVLEIAKNQV